MNKAVLFFIVGFLAAFGAIRESWAQGGPGTLQCGGSRVITDAGGSWLYLTPGFSKLTELHTSTGPIPRLVYWKRVTGSTQNTHDQCMKLWVREGGSGQSFGTTSDWSGVIPNSAFAPYVCPLFASVAAYDRFIAVSVEDGRQIANGVVQESNRTFLLELGPNGQLISNQVIVNSPILNAHPPVVRDLRFDHQPGGAAAQLGPLLSWVSDSAWPTLGAPDDVYYCHTSRCGQGANPAGIFSSQWQGLTKHWVTERSSPSAQMLNVFSGFWGPKTYLSPGLFDGGIFQSGTAGASVWLDDLAGTSPNYSEMTEEPLDHFAGLVFFRSGDRVSDNRLRVADYDYPPVNASAVYFKHSENYMGNDENFTLSQIDGLTYAGSGMGGNSDRFFAFDDRDSTARPELTGSVVGLSASKTLIATASDFSNLQPLNTFFTVPADHWSYIQGVSKNLFVVSILPDPLVYEPSYIDSFLKDGQSVLSYAFYCVH